MYVWINVIKSDIRDFLVIFIFPKYSNEILKTKFLVFITDKKTQIFGYTMKIQLNLRWVANRICTSNLNFGSGNCQNGTYRNDMEAFVNFLKNFYLLMTPNMQN